MKTKEDAITATNDFLQTVSHNDRAKYEELRKLVDEKNVLGAIGLKNLDEYLTQYFPSEWKAKATRNRLNNARMIHDFKLNGITVPLDVTFTDTRALIGAFKDVNDKNERLQLKIRAWKLATKKKASPNEVEVKKAIKAIAFEYADQEKLEDELIELREKYAALKEKSKVYYGDIPEDIQLFLSDKMGYPKMDNNFVSDSIKNINTMINNGASIEEVVAKIRKSFEIVQELLSNLSEYKEDPEKLDIMVDDICAYDTVIYLMRCKKSKMNDIKEKLETLNA